MIENPAAEMHAKNIEITLMPDRKIALLTIVNETQLLCSVTLPLPALESLQGRIAEQLSRMKSSAA